MKPEIGWACLGTHGRIYFCCQSLDPAKTGRFEIFQNPTDAERMALSKNHVVKVKIIPFGGKGRGKKVA